jgi:hypothetical protein
MESIRLRLTAALRGDAVVEPVYAVYDWFVQHRKIDWPGLFDKGLGQIAHASLFKAEYPNADIIETFGSDSRGPRRDVRWVTDIGELHEWYRGEWRQEYLIKTAKDYRVMARALEGTRFTATDDLFDRAEASVGENGVTTGQFGETAMESRTPLQSIQIDCAGLERFSMDLADEEPGLMELVELMEERLLERFRLVQSSKAVILKLWENLSIETMGPVLYRRHLVPFYAKLHAILEGTGKGLHVHYDGQLKLIAGDILKTGFAGIDSLTGPPEGDLSSAEARKLWPDTFLWLHPNLGWYEQDEAGLRAEIRKMAAGAGRNYCMMISEEVPPDWERTVPIVLNELSRPGGT